MNKLIDYLLRFGSLNAQQIDLIISKATTMTLKRGQYFSEAGKIAREVAFICKGVLRVCYFNKEEILIAIPQKSPPQNIFKLLQNVNY